MPTMMITEIGAKNGCACPKTSLAIQNATPAAIAVCKIGKRRLRTRVTRADRDSLTASKRALVPILSLAIPPA